LDRQLDLSLMVSYRPQRKTLNRKYSVCPMTSTRRTLIEIGPVLMHILAISLSLGHWDHLRMHLSPWLSLQPLLPKNSE
jgi:hypothetical protein